MSVTIGDVTVPADYCSPFILRLAERLESQTRLANRLADEARAQYDALKKKHGDLEMEYYRLLTCETSYKAEIAALKKQVGDLKKSGAPATTETAPAVVVSELSDNEIEQFRLLKWLDHRIRLEPGAEMRLVDACLSYRDWSKYNFSPKIAQKKHVMAFLKQKFGNAIDPHGKVLGGVCLKDEGDDDYVMGFGDEK